MARIIASALRDKPGLHVIAFVPRHPDSDGAITRMPGMLGQYEVIRPAPPPVASVSPSMTWRTIREHLRVHARVAVADDVRAIVGSDNLNPRSWSHDSELSIGVLDSKPDAREPVTLPVTETAPGRSPGTSACGYGASISTAGQRGRSPASEGGLGGV